MPINRYQIRNEYSLADPELYKIAGKDDPEVLLEGVAMAGLVGVLRQLGDLAQFATEIFHDLHEEVMSTAARGHNLIVRVQQLEAEFPSVEKALLLQTEHTIFLYNSGMDWHPNLHMDQHLVTQQDLPRFVLDSYEECRGPPRLFLLDKFDVAGAGACLKRYTDPSFFKEAPSTKRKSDKQRERRNRKAKKRGPRWRNGDTPLTYPSSHAKLHQLFLEENIEKSGISEDAERRLKPKNRQFSGSLLDQNKDRSYMEKILNAGFQQQKTADENCVDPLALTWPFENGCEYSPDIAETGTISPLKESTQTAQNASSLLKNMVTIATSSMDEFSKQKSDEIYAIEAEGVGGYDHLNGANKIPSTSSKIVLGEESDDGQRQSEAGVDGHNSDGLTSEIDSYLDAFATIDSKVETDSEGKNPHFSNLKSVMRDSNASEGKRKLLSNDAHINDIVVISEDDSTSFKGQDCSSCSVSVDIFAEITEELDAFVMSVPSTPNFNPHIIEAHVDDHSMTEENEPEKHADRSTFVEANESSEIGLSEEYVHEDEGGNLLTICVLNEDSGETYIDATKPILTRRIGDEGDANQSSVWSWDSEVADGAEEMHKGHSSHEELSMLDTTGGNSSFYPDSFPDLTHTHDGSVDLLLEASIRPDSDCSLNEEHSSGPARQDMAADIVATGLSLNTLFVSDVKHPEIVGPIGLVSNKDFCFTSFEELSENHSSESSLTPSSNFQEKIAETTTSGHAPQPDSSAESLSNTPEDLVIKEVIVVVKSEKEAPSPSSFSETVDTEGTNIPSVGSHEDEETQGYSIVTGDLIPVLDFSEAQEHRQALSAETDVALLKHHLAEPNGTLVYSDPATTVGDLDQSVLQVSQLDITSDHGHDDNHDNETILPDDSMIYIPSKLPSNSSFVLPSESNLDFHHDVAKVEIRAIVADGSRQDDENFQLDNGTLPSSSSSLNPEAVQEHVSGKKDSSQSIIKPSPNFLGHDTLNGRNQATKGVDNSGKPIYPLGFSTFSMNPTETQINLDAPPLPPLPPMQWRLSRFLNSSAAPDRRMLQNTLDPSQPKHAAVLKQYSQDEKYEFEEENLSITNASMSVVGSQNGTQLSENGFVVQQGTIALPMFQSTSVAREGQVLQHTTDFVQTTLTTILEAPSHANMKEFRSEDNLSVTIPTSVRCHVGTQDPINGYGVYSENNMSGVKREDDPLSIPTSTCYLDGNQMSEGSYQPCEDLHESTSLVEDHSCGKSQIEAEAKSDAEIGSHDELLIRISQDNKEEVVNSAYLVSPEAGRTIDEVRTSAGADTKETLQKKPPRPRNPLIHEVVAVDKSKLRKVERVKQSLELKPGGDLRLEKMQLKKVERVKPLVEGKVGNGESSLEHVRLRKTGERAIQEVEQNLDETKSPRIQFRKVPKRAHPLLDSKFMERDSLLEQIRTKSFNLKPAVMSRPNLQGPSVQGPRANLKVAAILQKASNIRQAMAGSDEEDDGDSWSDC